MERSNLHAGDLFVRDPSTAAQRPSSGRTLGLWNAVVVWDAPVWPGVVAGPYQGAYSAIGANGQYITVLPAMNLVLVHKVDFDAGSQHISPGEFHTILQMVIESVCSGDCK